MSLPNQLLARSFDANPDGYRCHRPGYPPELFEAIFRYARLSNPARCLEIGAGAGQATQAFLIRGCHVHALEPGIGLADQLRAKLGHLPNLQVSQSGFEEFDAQDGCYDLIYSASAFHWLPKQTAYQKAFHLLKPKSTLALFWASFSVNRPIDPSHQALQTIFARHEFKMTEAPNDLERYQRKQNSLVKRGFVDVACEVFKADHFLRPCDFLNFLATTSRFLILSPEQKAALKSEILDSLESYKGVWLDQTCDLYLAKRPAHA